MPTINFGRSDVFLEEVDLSQLIVNNDSARVGLIVGEFERGTLERTNITTAKEFIRLFGDINSIAYGETAFAVTRAIRGLQSIHVKRITSEPDNLYGGLVLDYNSFATTVNKYGLVSDETVSDPSVVTKASLEAAAGVTTAYAYFRALGPGDYSKTIRLAIGSKNIYPIDDADISVAEEANPNGNLVAASTYYYSVSAVSSLGETLGSTELSLLAVSSDVAARITWTPVPGATSYNIYSRSSDSIASRSATTLQLIASVGAFATDYVDIGTANPDSLGSLDATGAIVRIVLPTDLGSGVSSRYTATDTFTVYVYDTRISASQPVENFNCTLHDNINPNGVNTELETQINGISEYIHVTNYNNFADAPSIYTILVKSMGKGSTASPKPQDYITAWNSFNNTDDFRANIFINGGYAVPVVQKAMVTNALKHRAICLIDIPKHKQTAQLAANYASNELSIDNNRVVICGQDINVYDEYIGKIVNRSPSGYIAELIGREKSGKSVAGLNRGKVLDGLTVYHYNEDEQNQLVENGVNYFRAIRGSGVVWWEQFTSQKSSSALSFLNVRMIVDTIELSIQEALMFQLQEPNDDFLVEKITQMTSQYLDTKIAAREIASYQVIAGDSINGPNVLGQGQRNVDVILEPILPAHKIRLRTILLPQGGAEFVETILNNIQ